MKQFAVIAITHRQIGLDLLGKFHVQPSDQVEKFSEHLSQFGIQEFMFLSTCNRVEFFMRTRMEVDQAFIRAFLETNYSNVTERELKEVSEQARIYQGIDAVRHIFHVASSLDSLIVGEREIITQVRKAHDLFASAKLSGDFIRIAITKAIETAKAIYTETEIATKPISVVNLGYRRLLDRELNGNQRVVFIGAGSTIEAIAGNMKAFSFKETKVFNRTPERAKKLARNINGVGFPLSDLEKHIGDFDVLITCTAAENRIIDLPMYRRIVNGSESRKLILDLAVPADIDPAITKQKQVDYISIDDLKLEAKRNLKEREKEIFHCEKLVEERLLDFEDAFRARRLELAMQKVPKLMKDIKTQAIENKFARDINNMTPAEQDTLMKIIDYLEKKYIAIPMKMAKEVVLDKDLKDSIID